MKITVISTTVNSIAYNVYLSKVTKEDMARSLTYGPTVCISYLYSSS